MAGIMNILSGAKKNIAAAARTDGVLKRLVARSAAGAGIGAAAGGTMSAIQGGSFGEGAVRGGIMGGMAGAASGVYKMGAFGEQSLDASGRFRKGATSIYSTLVDNTSTWDQVNRLRAKDADAFMNNIRSASSAEDLKNRFMAMDKEAKKKPYQAPTATSVPVQGPPVPPTKKPYEKPTITNPRENFKPNFVDVTPNGYSTNYPSSNLMGLPAGTGTNIQQNYNMLSTDLSKMPSQSSAVSGYLPVGTTQKHYNEFANSVASYKNGGNRWNRIESEGRKIAQGLYNVDNVSTDQMVEGVSRFMESHAGQQMRKRYASVNRGYESFLNGVTS